MLGASDGGYRLKEEKVEHAVCEGFDPQNFFWTLIEVLQNSGANLFWGTCDHVDLCHRVSGVQP